jgi:uncharacterized protein DUF3106
MSAVTNQRFSRIILLGVSQLLGACLLSAQGQTNASATVLVNSGTVSLGDLLPPCPVELFRELITKDRQAQEKLLAEHKLQDRKEIFAKVREYKALKPSQRELRLKATELRWYLRRLMDLPPERRPALLARLSENDRKLVQARLDYWDKLPNSARQEFRTNEAAITYFTMPPEQRSLYVSNALTSARSNMLVHGIAYFNALPEQKRQKVLEQFNEFFEFRPEERQKILSPLSEPERQQIEKTLKKFGELSAADRAACVQSFGRFAMLSIEERQQFLKNAEHWKLMPPSERRQWRELVEDLSQLPPMPPDLELPPMPPGFPSAALSGR